jgi:sulfonate dioxygenase
MQLLSTPTQLPTLTYNPAFRDQDFASRPIQEVVDYAGYFGRHHVHQTSGAPKGFPEVHLVFRGADDRTGASFLEQRTNTITWHSDVTFEKQPPGTTFLYVLDGPTTGGDTLFADMVQAYKRLSPEFRKRLHGLKAVHSGLEQVNASLNGGGIARRDPITSEHPIVRTHPVTGEKALYVNPQCKSSYLTAWPSPVGKRTNSVNSHPLHRRLQERGVRRSPKVLV